MRGSEAQRVGGTESGSDQGETGDRIVSWGIWPQLLFRFPFEPMSFQVAGGGPGWQVAGRDVRAERTGRREG